MRRRELGHADLPKDESNHNDNDTATITITITVAVTSTIAITTTDLPKDDVEYEADMLFRPAKRNKHENIRYIDMR